MTPPKATYRSLTRKACACLILGGLLVAAVFLLTPDRTAQPSPCTDPAAISSGDADPIATTPPAVRAKRTAGRMPQTDPPTGPHGALLNGSLKLASLDTPTAKGFRRTSVHRTTFKHPLIRVVEDFETGVAAPVRSVAMVSDLVLVRLQDGDSARLNAFLRQHPESSIHRTLATGQHVLVQIPGGHAPNALEHWQSLLQTAGLKAAEPDYIYHPVTLPNDTDFTQLWGLHNTGQDGGTADADIDAPEAWNITTGSNQVVVAVADVGVDYNHPDLAANIWSHPTTGKHGRDCYQNDDDPMDDSSSSGQAHGHGTHISGTIAGVGNNGSGVVGVCWNARIMAIRIGDADTGSNDTADAIEGMRWATDNGAKVMNLSWGGGGGSIGDNLNQEVIYARNHGVILAAAAGNSSSNNETSHNYPSDYPEDNIIAVAASDRNDTLASFSSYGATSVDLAAPGKAIRSTVPNGLYATHDGTSMATPHVVGAVALVWAADPSLTYSQVRSRLLTHVDQKSAFTGKVATGGRLNVFKAIEDLAGPVLALSRKNPITLGGNGDAYPNPSESVRLDLTLENTGSETATTPTIAASLSAGAPATLNRTSLAVGTLASHASSAQDGAFTLTLNSSVTLPATFTVNLTLTTPAKPGSTWTDTIQITVYEAATVHGQVTRAGTGAPLSGATIAVRGPVNLDLTSGADGRYNAPAVAGSYQLSARASGLLDSAARSETVSTATGDIDFALGTASLALAPATLNITVAPNQIRNLAATATHTGDSPRAIPFTTSITGTGLSVDKLYGIDMETIYLDGIVKVHEINPDTGAKTATHNLPALGQMQFILGSVFYQGKIWLLISDWSQGGSSVPQLFLPLDPATWTFGTAVTINPPSGVDFNGLAATEDRLLLTARDSNTYTYALYEFLPATSTLTKVGNLPQAPKGPITYSKSRASLFLPFFSMSEPGETVKELAYPTLTEIRQWSAGTDDVQAVSYDEQQEALFVGAYVGGGAPALNKRNPDTGTVITGFTAVADVTLCAVHSAAQAGWLTTTLATSDVATGASREIPLAVNTAGMTLGQSFTAQVHTTSSLTAEPTPVTVNLTVGNLDPSVWNGWFETRYNYSPLPADRLTDSDHDGIPAYLEFATGGDPQSSIAHDGQPISHVSANGSMLEFSFHRRKTLAAGSLIAETSDDLTEWHPLPTAVPGTTQTASAVDASFERIVISIPISGQPQRFVRLTAP